MSFNLIKKHYIFIILVFFGFCYIAEAKVIISEVSINPTDKRFIELYNSSSSSVSLTGYYIQRKTENGVDFTSLVSKTYFEGISIPAEGYLVISRSSNTYTDVLVPSLTLTASNTLQLKNPSKEIVDFISFGELVDGESIHKDLSGSKDLSEPTPGYGDIENSSYKVYDDEEVDITEDEEDDSGLVIAGSISNKEDKIEESLKVKTKIISPKVVFSGIPFEIYSETYTNKGVKYNVGDFLWNFGDGRSLKKDNEESFDYVYDYPGEYVLVLSYYDTFFSKIPEATDKVILKVLPSSLNITSVGNYNDPYVEIENKSNYEISLKNWSIMSFDKVFKISEGTIILPNKKIKFSPKITGFLYEDLKYIKIIDPNGNIVATYPSVNKTNVIKKLNTAKVSSVVQTEVLKDIELEELIDNKNVINLNDLGANVSSPRININPIFISILGLGIIIFFSLYVLFSFRKKDKEEDLKDLEGEISEKDITLIE